MFPFIFPKFLATWIILSCQGWLNTEEKHSGETEYNSAQDYNHKSTSWSKSQIATYQKESTWGTLSNKNTRKCGNFRPIYPLFFWSFCGSLAIPTFFRFSLRREICTLKRQTEIDIYLVQANISGAEYARMFAVYQQSKSQTEAIQKLQVGLIDYSWHLGSGFVDLQIVPSSHEQSQFTINVNFSTISSNTWHRHPCQCIRLPSQNGVDAEETLRMEERRPTTTTGPFFSLTSAASLGTEWSWWRRQSWCLRWEAPEDWLWCRGSVAAAGSPSTPSLYKRSRVK